MTNKQAGGRPPFIRLVIPKGDPDLTNKVARNYIMCGWQVVSWPLGTKGDNTKWAEVEINLSNVDQYFPKGMRKNIGVRLGAFGLADGDLDCKEAVLLAEHFMLATDAIFGRRGKPRSHWLYYAPDAVGLPKAVLRFEDEDKGCLLELRWGTGGRAIQTIFPGSVHESGEEIEWSNNGEPAEVMYGTLLKAARHLAAACLLLRGWPTMKGGRHECAFITGAFLARAGLSLEEIEYMVRVVATAAGDDEVHDRWQAARSSAENTLAGQQTYGMPKMIEQYGEGRVKALAKILEYKTVDEDDTLERCNEKWCVVKFGGSVFVVERAMNEMTNQMGIELLRPREFTALYDNKRVGKKGLATWWFKHPERKQYTGLCFEPGQPRVIGGHFNLWREWGVAPAPGDWSLMRQHIKDVIADGNAAYETYIVRWLAWTFQNPGKQAEVALVLQGGKGAGKGVFALAIKRAFGDHGRHISTPDHLTGKFNMHLSDCALLFADEAWWPGDKKSEGNIKRLVTEPTLLIEKKRADSVEMKNCMHIIMAANAEWIVPASHDERRYAVFRVSNKYIGNFDYFEALHKERDNGGIGAMMHDLMNMDIGTWHPRRDVPRTKALSEQQQASLSPFEAAWFELIHDGRVPGLVDDSGVPKAPCSLLYKYMKELSPRLQPESPNTLGKKFDDVGCPRTRIKSKARARQMLPLAEARAAWDKLYGPQGCWDGDNAWSTLKAEEDM